MSQDIQREKLVETLLNTLEAERYCRAPLLATIVDELTNERGLEVAACAARTLLDGLETGKLAPSEFASRIGELRDLVHAVLSALAGPTGDALTRATPRPSQSSHSASAA
jgi:hypothetical protein